MASDEGEHLNPSKLGTKYYWDHAYERETLNFATNPEDEGQIWFSESDAETRILDYLSSEGISPTSSFLDVGTGNGHLLFELIAEGDYSGKMVGIDYSAKGIELARKIAEEREVEGVEFEVVDVIKDDLEGAAWVPEGGFDVVLDKGTFDAISLSEETLGDGRRVYELYAEKVRGVIKRGALLVVTSCNWTEEELRRKMLVVDDLEYYGKIKYPSFKFGGQEGQTISSVCFRRKELPA
ncbi:Protein-lysine N-methyltransferase efm4 [Rhizina undulata]